MTDEILLDHIIYDDFFAEFRRVEGKSVDYYHWHQCLEVLYIESGIGIVVVDNQQYTLKPGRMFIFPQGKLHKVTVENSRANHYKRSIFHIDASFLASYFDAFNQLMKRLENLSHPGSKAFIIDLDKKDYISRIIDLFEAKYHSTSNKVEVIALLLLNIFMLFPDNTYIENLSATTLSSKIMHFIEQCFRSRITLKEIAGNLGISESYASRVFRKETGGTIQEYLLIRRVKYSCELLDNSELSVEEVSRQSGFNHVTYYIRCFKDLLGCTPLRYKNKQNSSL